MKLKNPIAIFDTGLGSYTIVEAVHKAYPKQDIIYFADRKNFPYGEKTISELKNIIEDSINFLLEENAFFIILASNSPSITTLSAINFKKIIGIYPPIAEVVKNNKKNTLILGAKVMTESEALKNYIKKEAPYNFEQFHTENASSLINLIENGNFINNIELTTDIIKNFLDSCKEKYGNFDSITLSSTHLPWLSSYFKKIVPEVELYDPSQKIIEKIKPYISEGNGKIFGIISESEKYPALDFLKILKNLNIEFEYKIKK